MKAGMTPRRTILGGMAAALAVRPSLAAAAVKHPLKGTVGLELYTVRQFLEKDLPGTLAKVRKMGFTDVELPPGLYGKTIEDWATALKKAGLKAHAQMATAERLEKDLPALIKGAETLGVKWVICPWLPHKEKLTRPDVDKFCDLFTKAAKALKERNLGFAYHVHGYEFEPSPDGTLMETFLKNTPPDLVFVEMDVFWVRRGGEDPVALFGRHPGRFPLAHLKDIAKGTEICRPNGKAPDESSVPLGTGMIDWPGVLRAAEKSGTALYFIEDEHPEALRQVPQSLAYLRTLKL